MCTCVYAHVHACVSGRGAGKEKTVTAKNNTQHLLRTQYMLGTFGLSINSFNAPFPHFTDEDIEAK